MPPKTAKLFTNGGSQAVRLPAEFRFEGTEEIYIRRDAVTGEVILSAKPVKADWAEFFALREQFRDPSRAEPESEDFMAERPLNEPLKPRKLLQGR